MKQSAVQTSDSKLLSGRQRLLFIRQRSEYKSAIHPNNGFMTSSKQPHAQTYVLAVVQLPSKRQRVDLKKEVTLVLMLRVSVWVDLLSLWIA